MQIVLTQTKSDINTFISDNYDILYQNPNIDSAGEADAFLLCDIHSNLSVRKTNSQFIEKYAQPHATVLVESMKPGETVNHERNLQSYLIRRQDLNYKGWDALSEQEIREEYDQMMFSELKDEWEEKRKALNFHMEVIWARMDRERALQDTELPTEDRVKYEQEFSALSGILLCTGVRETHLNLMRERSFEIIAQRQFSLENECLDEINACVGNVFLKVFLVAGRSHLDIEDNSKQAENLSKSLKFIEQQKIDSYSYVRVTEEKEAMEKMLMLFQNPAIAKSLESLKAKKIVIMKPKSKSKYEAEFQNITSKLDEFRKRAISPNEASQELKKSLAKYYERAKELSMI